MGGDRGWYWRGQREDGRPTAEYNRTSHTSGQRKSIPHCQGQLQDADVGSPIPTPRQALDSKTRTIAKIHFKLTQALHKLGIIHKTSQTKYFSEGVIHYEIMRLTEKQFIKS